MSEKVARLGALYLPGALVSEGPFVKRGSK